jgi:hypothetical protein
MMRAAMPCRAIHLLRLALLLGNATRSCGL